ncbi:hypothetical protein [Polynucleobacter sp. MG-27-Goln-C1]|uniref:hypothetical protein n=1 Tax=Polynucleobacter sp. MG-27-Goln-C1 TaxID=1819726 RepID=UPI001C0D7A1E|nr:hypothetical protein [Polynucleobacter sp. MG-27-Goln-C1]MBU3612848.1 hypothetical protein [Polynucleobacter sp. MG-27-Goln-C1]
MLNKKIFFTPLLFLSIAFCFIQYCRSITINNYWNEYLMWAAGYAIASILLSKLTNISIPKLTFFIILIIGVMSGNGVNLAILYFIAAASITFGYRINHFVSSSNPGTLYNLMAGIALLAAMVGLSSHFPINYAGLYVSVLIIITAASWRHFSEINQIFIGFVKNNPALEKSTTELLLEGLIGSLAIVYFLIALMPEIGYDALVSHLVVPERMAYYHKWIYDPKILIWSLGPLNANWVFTIPYMITNSEVAVRITSLGFLAIICYLIRDLVITFNRSKKEYLIAILLLLSTPLTLLESSTLFTDLIWTAYLVGGVVILFKISLDLSLHSQKFLFLVGLFLGMAMGVKLTTLFILPTIFLLYLYNLKKHGFLILEFFKSILFFLLIGCISYAYSYWVTGNPLFPFYNEIFKSPLYPPEKFIHPFKPGISWDLINQITFNSKNFIEGGNGSPGFQWVLLFLPSFLLILFLRNKWVLALLLFASTFILGVFNTVGYLRYVYPAFVLLTIFIAIAIGQSNKFGSTVKIIFSALVCLVFSSNLLFFKAASGYSDVSFPVIFNNTKREAYIESRVPMRKAVAIVNELNLNNSPVAILSTAPYIAGLHAIPLIGWWYNYSFSKAIFEVENKKQLALLFSRHKMEYLLLDDSWSTPERRELVKNLTSSVEKIGNISVLKVDNEINFQYDLLQNIKFPQDWTLADGAKVLEGKYLKVTVNSPAVTMVSVGEFEKVKYIAEAKCSDRVTDGRLQVNWMDSKGQFISTSITTFECERDFKSYSVEMRSPPKSSNAIVYATSHSEIPVIFKKISVLE